MSKYTSFGGLRLKLQGRKNKDEIISIFTTFLNAMYQENELESLSGINLYLQIHDKNGDKLALVGADNVAIQGIEFSSIDESFSFSGVGFKLIPVKRLEEIEMQQLAKQKKAADERQAEINEQRKKEQLEKQELSDFRSFICNKYNLKHVNDLMSSLGRIKDRKAILKYLPEGEIPQCGYVLRATHKSQLTGKPGLVELYDNSFTLIYERDIG